MAENVSYVEVFQNKEFMKLLSGQFFSNFGDAILQVATLLYVYSFTGDLSLTTTVLAVQFIPWIIVGPVAGALADRISRKGIMVFSDCLRAIAIVLLPFQQSITGIIVITFLIGVASSAFVAPRSAVIPEITGMRLFVKAISLSQLVFQTMRIVGPIFSAFIYAEFGVVTFYFAGGTYIFSLIIILLTKIPDANSTEKIALSLVLNDLKAGIVYLLTEKVIRKVLILFTILMVGSAFGNLLYPYIYEVFYNEDPNLESMAQKQYGLIGAFSAAGAIVGNFTFGAFEHVIGRRIALFVGFMGIGFYFFLFPFMPSMQAIFIIALLSGFFNGVFSLGINAIFAETVPNEIRARAYSATNSYLMMLNVISTTLTGYIAELFGLSNAIMSAGAFIIGFSLLLAILTKFYKFAQSPASNEVQVQTSSVE
ncbi:MAG: MFS transporter [Candidatus Heimdallarchaeota archaeon]|nr:MFS transporter [Candidatus Heimdallarchaeota archaeon]